MDCGAALPLNLQSFLELLGISQSLNTRSNHQNGSKMEIVI